MILSLILLVLCLAVAFFHYTQGLFSATLSAIISVIAAIVAIAYHEALAAYIAPKFPEQAAALSLVLIFAAVFALLRFVFDRLIQGNVRLPVIMDKIGSGVMGLVAGLMATGVLAVAADSLPFGMTIGGYSRYALLDDVHGFYRGQGRDQDAVMHDEVKSDFANVDDNTHMTTYAPIDPQHLIFQQDDLVVALTSMVSGDGSLGGDQPWKAVHPDYPTELYNQRMGIQEGSRHVLLSTDADKTVAVKGVYTQPLLTQVDGEIARIRQRDVALPPILKPDPTQKIVIVRVVFSDAKMIADDADSIMRFSPGSIRLAAGTIGDDGSGMKDYYPVATLDSRGVAVAHRPDDFMFSVIKGARTIDFVFLVDNDALGGTKIPTRLKDAFIEVKRYGRVDISNQKVDYGPPINPDTDSVMTKPDVDAAIKAAKPADLLQPGGDTSGAPAQ